jgi:hypothetical protein
MIFQRRLQRVTVPLVILILISLLYWIQIQRRSEDVFWETTHINGKVDRSANLHITESKRQCDELSSQYNLQNMNRIDTKTCEKFKILCGLQSCDAMLDVVYLWVNGSVRNLKKLRHSVLKIYNCIGL